MTKNWLEDKKLLKMTEKSLFFDIFVIVSNLLDLM